MTIVDQLPSPNLRLKPEVKQAWLDALRSGKYKQIRGVLRNSEGPELQYCCLGVLCELSGLGKFVTKNKGGADRHDVFVDNENNYEAYTMPPSQVWDWAVMNMSRSINATEVVQTRLVSMNDGQVHDPDHELEDVEPRSFNEIADWIEENL